MADRPALKRRTVLLGAALGALAPAPGALAAGVAASDPLAALRAWLDTLIPGDETPSASASGVVEAVLADARPDARVIALLEGGCRWLDTEARLHGGTDFASLPEAAREEIAHIAAASAPVTGQHMFFELTWRSAVRHYYARPEIWPSLGYDGPPQPRGFPNADRKP